MTNNDRSIYFNLLSYRRLLCIFYEKELKIKSINYKNNKSGRKTSIYLSEIITILIIFQAIRYKNFKTYYIEFIQTY